MSIAKNIRIARKAAGLTQEELAQRINVKKQTVQKYEAGIIGNIPSDKIEAMAQALGTTPSALMGWEDPQPVSDDDIKFALFGGADGITDEQFEEVKRFSQYIKDHPKEKNKD